MPNESEKNQEKCLTQAEVSQLLQERIAQERRRYEGLLSQQKAAREQAEDALRERENTLRERDEQLRAQQIRSHAQAELNRRGLPQSLLGALQCGSEEALTQSLAAVEGAFRESLERGVRDRLRGGIEMVFDPAQIVVVVVIAKLDEIGRILRPPHLAERCGRLRRHLCRQRVDHAQLRGEELGSTLSVAARGIVKDDDAAVLPRLPLPRGVGVQGKVKVKAAEAVRLRDGRGRGHLRRVAHKGDGVCVKIRLERVCQQIHPVFLAAAAVDIRVPILRGGTQINSGHVQNLPSFPVYA